MAGRRDTFKFIRWARDQHLRGARQSVLVILATHADAAGISRPGISLLAKEAGVSVRAATYALRSLESDGYLRRNGQHHVPGTRAHTTIWQLTGAIQPPLLPADNMQPLHAVKSPNMQPLQVDAEEQPATDVRSTCKVTMGELPRTTKGSTTFGSLPNGKDPQVSPSDGDVSGPTPRARFLTEQARHRQVAAFIDLGKEKGVRLKGERVTASEL